MKAEEWQNLKQLNLKKIKSEQDKIHCHRFETIPVPDEEKKVRKKLHWKYKYATNVKCQM